MKIHLFPDEELRQRQREMVESNGNQTFHFMYFRNSSNNCKHKSRFAHLLTPTTLRAYTDKLTGEVGFIVVVEQRLVLNGSESP